MLDFWANGVCSTDQLCFFCVVVTLSTLLLYKLEEDEKGEIKNGDEAHLILITLSSNLLQ